MPAEFNARGGALPNLPAGWEWRHLGELVDRGRGICYGIVQPGAHDPAGVPMVNTQDVFNGAVNHTIAFRVASALNTKFRRSQLRGGEILVTLVGANFGRVAIAPACYAGYNCSRAVGVVPVQDDAPFISLCLRSPLAQQFMQIWANTTAQPTFNLSDLARLPVPMPPKPERDRIAEVLTALDDKIDLNRRTNQTLEDMAEALFRAWFVDFEPVRVKAEGRLPAGVDAETAALFPSRLVDSGVGAIPEGWQPLPLGALIELEKGVSYKGEFLTEHGAPMVNLKCIRAGGGFNGDGLKNYSGPASPRHMVARGEVVVANTDLTQAREVLGAPALIPQNMPPTSVFSHHIFAVRRRDPTAVSSLFIFYLLRTDAYRERAAGFATGTTVLALPKDAVLGHVFPFPPTQVMNAFTQLADVLRQKTEQNTAEARTLTHLRDLLLPKLLSGEVRVRDAEAQVAVIA